MSMSRIAALLAGLLLVAMFANAASRNTIRITVLDSETRSLGLNDNGVPDNCDQLTFDAYCRSSRTAPLMNTLVVQEGNNPPFRISCRAESKMSKCEPLPKGETFDARREKKGVTVYYLDDKGKLRSQLYTLVAGDAKGKAASPAAAEAAVPAIRVRQARLQPQKAAQATGSGSGQVPTATVAPSGQRGNGEVQFQFDACGGRGHGGWPVCWQHAVGARADHGQARRGGFDGWFYAVEAGTGSNGWIGTDSQRSFGESAVSAREALRKCWRDQRAKVERIVTLCMNKKKSCDRRSNLDRGSLEGRRHRRYGRRISLGCRQGARFEERHFVKEKNCGY